jgi:hypothetical protein
MRAYDSADVSRTDDTIQLHLAGIEKRFHYRGTYFVHRENIVVIYLLLLRLEY